MYSTDEIRVLIKMVAVEVTFHPGLKLHEGASGELRVGLAILIAGLSFKEYLKDKRSSWA
ncbi:TPA: hypothetical protein L5Q98_002065 [Pseudomonas aeruginosa]|uniref:hypothetical protein n=1 Tax=Pseudomonas aeruginosa TaxID=287 RepID=UPI00129E5931|nr:hypothetical protein [Pseudomonas aeruginosa]ELK4796661.1 hypothetical protein [Pseudomonas aeruginosa]MBH3767374.1 hypothetical protein [Pseudomonas aeruginosa]QPP28312.1 hypothetical protein I6A80_000692 [Pseudomonas aeruginosa]WAE23486.1 hypothetical protein OUY23_03375 [Pseudomonas aeruginosa]HBP0855493.1 hypothetical protein [Pseudomonas aeruginosa]